MPPRFMRKMAELERENLRGATEKSWKATLKDTNALIWAGKLCEELDGAKQKANWSLAGTTKPKSLRSLASQLGCST